LGRLAAADAAAEAAGLEPAYADTVSLYRAAKAIDTGGKSPALPPAAAAAKAALTSATPSPRGGPAAQPAITAPPRDAWLDEALAGPADPFKV
jgi:hypothetical protein